MPTGEETSVSHSTLTPTASLILVTYNRVKMLRMCVSSIIANTDGPSYELIVWDNASTDGTAQFLDSVAAAHRQVRVFHSPENIGLNGVAAAVRLARGHHLVEMDDDVLDVPDGWLAEMIRSFDAVPKAGYLAANVVQNDLTDGAKLSPQHYAPIDFGNGVIIEMGPLGGWCTITSRDVIDDIGNFVEMPGRIFFGEDSEFLGRCILAGYRVGIIRSVRVFHACGAIANQAFDCLDVCRLKYSDHPDYAPYLKHTLAVTATDDDNHSARLEAMAQDARDQVSVAVRPTPPLDESAMARALRAADRYQQPFVAEARLKQRLRAGDYSEARRLLWAARSMNPRPFRRMLMLALGFASPRSLGRRWERLASDRECGPSYG